MIIDYGMNRDRGAMEIYMTLYPITMSQAVPQGTDEDRACLP